MVGKGYKSWDPSEEQVDTNLKLGHLFASKNSKCRIMNFDQYITPSEKWLIDWHTSFQKFDSWDNLKVEGEEGGEKEGEENQE